MPIRLEGIPSHRREITWNVLHQPASEEEAKDRHLLNEVQGKTVILL